MSKYDLFSEIFDLEGPYLIFIINFLCQEFQFEEEFDYFF